MKNLKLPFNTPARRVLLVAAASAVALTACGGGDDEAGSTTAAAATEAPAATSADSMEDESMEDESMEDESMGDESMEDEGDHDDGEMEDESIGDGGVAEGSYASFLASAEPVEGSFDPASLEGKDTVVWFWAPWCSTCRSEGPGINEAQAKYGDQVNFVGVGGLGELEEMKGFVNDTGTTGFPQLGDVSGDVWADFGVDSMPAFAFINDDGTAEIVKGALGTDGLSEQLDALIAA